MSSDVPPRPKTGQQRDLVTRSRELVMRSHERAQQAVDRAARIREALRSDREVLRAGQQETRRRVRLLQLAAEEGMRSLREKDRFLARVSHELRQPLNAALAALRMVEVGGAAAATAHTILRRQLLQLTRLVDDLLDVSRMSIDVMDMRLGHVDLAEVLDDAVATIEPELTPHQLTLVRNQFDPGACVWGDNSRLRQVFSNLLANAVRYTPPGGEISLTATIEGARVCVAVTDTGQGIPEADLQRIFDPFTRGGPGTTHEGLGIGLALVRGIVELHHGSTEASSPGLGGGSTFKVTLPLCPHPFVRSGKPANSGE